MDKRSENTLVFSQAGLINNPKVCIKGMTTCVCVCPKCTEEHHEMFKKILEVWDKI